MDQSPVNPYAAPRADAGAPGRPVLTTDEMQAFLGTLGDGYYEGKWAKANRSGGWYCGFNWAAAIFGSLWMFYRRMPVEGAIFFGVRVALVWGKEMLAHHISPVTPRSLDFFVLAVCSLATGFLGNALYLRRARLAVEQVRQDLHRTDGEAHLTRIGRPSGKGVLLGILAEGGALLVLRVLMNALDL